MLGAGWCWIVLGAGWCRMGARWHKCEQDTSVSVSMSANRIISGCCWIMLGARWCWIVLGAGWCRTTIRKRRSSAFKQKKVYQNRTIMKEVNVHPAPIRIQHKCRTIWHPSGTRLAPIRHRCRIVQHSSDTPSGTPSGTNESPSWNLHELIFLKSDHFKIYMSEI